MPLDPSGLFHQRRTRIFPLQMFYIRFLLQEEKTRGKATELLLSRGADVNIMDDVGRTALSYACELKCNDIVRILVKNNVDPDIPDKSGWSGL